MAWTLEGRAVNRAHRALHLRGYSTVRQPEPFAAVILCTSDPEKVDDRTRSKWSRVLRYAAQYKDLDEPNSVREPEPFAAIIYCTADHDKVDDRTRSKWSRVLRHAAEFKDLGEPLREFIKRKGGINKCAARFARRLGRGNEYRAAAGVLRRGGCSAH